MNSSLLISLVSFTFIVLASQKIGQFFARFSLPLISGYLIAGIIAGPFVLSFMTSVDVENLWFLDDIALAFIAFAAGSEMYLEELHGRFRSIAWNTITQLIAVYLLVGGTLFLIADAMPFTAELGFQARIAVAILAGTILVARFPSSAIAIINELRARGPFTKTVLGVTLVKDVIVIVLFAIGTSLASTLLTGEVFDMRFVILVTLEIVGAMGMGIVVGKIIAGVLSTHLPEYAKIAMILLIGFAVFIISAELRHFSEAILQFEILLEPLLICMVASFWITNRTVYRDEFRYLLHRVEAVIFIIFFTLVGESLNVGIVMAILPLTLVIFFIRSIALFVGGYVGGIIANDPPQFNRLTWMAYVTQAGVGLALAKEVALEFPQLGNEFSTVLIAVIVLGQIVGPPLFKFAIRRVGEAHTPGFVEADDRRDVLIFGIEQQSRALAERLAEHNWTVVLADTNSTLVSYTESGNIQQRMVNAVSIYP